MNKGFANRLHLKILASMITSHLLDFVVVGNRATKEEEEILFFDQLHLAPQIMTTFTHCPLFFQKMSYSIQYI